MNTPDYQKYSDKELHEALASIDRDAFPENFQRLKMELSDRTKVTTVEKDLTNSNAIEDELTNTNTEEYWSKENIIDKQKSALLNYGSYFGVMFFIGLGAPAYFYSFFTHVSLYGVIDRVCIAIAIVVALGVFIKFYKASKKPRPNDGRLRKIFRLKSVKEEIFVARLLFVPFSMLFGFIVYFGTTKGLPILLHSYTLEKHSTFIVATIEDTSPGLRKHGCDREVHLKEYHYSFFDYICSSRLNVNWKDLKKGDKIKLYGDQSKLGFLVKSAKILN